MKALVIITAYKVVNILDPIPNNPDGPADEQEALEEYKDHIDPYAFVGQLVETNYNNVDIKVLKVA